VATDGEKSLMIRLAVSTQYRRVTDRQTSCESAVRAMHVHRALKTDDAVREEKITAASRKSNPFVSIPKAYLSQKVDENSSTTLRVITLQLIIDRKISAD